MGQRKEYHFFTDKLQLFPKELAFLLLYFDYTLIVNRSYCNNPELKGISFNFLES